jgi:hypothetical protein
MAKKPRDETEYDERESQERFKAALIGARIAGHVPMKAKPKVKKAAKKATKKAKKPLVARGD